MTGSVHRAGVSPAPSDAEQSAFVHGAFADSSGSTAIVAALDDAGLSVIGEAARGSGNVTALVLVAAYVLDEQGDEASR